MLLLVDALAGLFESVAHFLLETLRLRRSRGWRVEPLGAGQLRGADDEIAVVYHEGANSLWFGGTKGANGARDRLEVPTRESWDAAVEPWARGRRDEVLERVAADVYVRRRVELVERALPPGTYSSV